MKFEIREGNGNDGTYKRGHVDASNAFVAIRKASRINMICKPRDIEGDSVRATVCSYVRPIFGSDCRWIAEAILDT